MPNDSEAIQGQTPAPSDIQFIHKCRFSYTAPSVASRDLVERASRFKSTIVRYIDPQYTASFLNDGRVLLRSLGALRQIECSARRDEREGRVEWSVTTPTEGPLPYSSAKDPTTSPAFRRTFISESSFVFSDRDGFVLCMSGRPCRSLATRFGNSDCILITNPARFLKRVDVALRSQFTGIQNGLVEAVIYYEDPAPATPIAAPPVCPAFLKPIRYLPETEIRAFWPMDPAPLRQSVVLSIGSLHDVCRVVRKDELAQYERTTVNWHPIFASNAQIRYRVACESGGPTVDCPPPAPTNTLANAMALASGGTGPWYL